MNGLLVTFEGIDGCGKSTQITLLAEWLEEQNLPYSLYREPGGTDLSERVREILLNTEYDIDPITELLLFSAARSRLLVERVLPALEGGQLVLLDRFYDSTTAYQGYGRGSSFPEEIDRLNRMASHGRVPDLTFYFKISPDLAKKRRGLSSEDRMELSGNSFFERVAKGFDEIAETEDRVVTLDASQPVARIHERVVEIISSKLT